MKAHVVSVCFKCFRRFRGMLQLFHMHVAKVDRRWCTCCKCFRGVVQNVSSILDVCCTRFDLDIVAEPPHLMPPRSTCLTLDTKYPREDINLSSSIEHTTTENSKIYIFSSES